MLDSVRGYSQVVHTVAVRGTSYIMYFSCIQADLYRTMCAFRFLFRSVEIDMYGCVWIICQ